MYTRFTFRVKKKRNCLLLVLLLLLMSSTIIMKQNRTRERKLIEWVEKRERDLFELYNILCIVRDGDGYSVFFLFYRIKMKRVSFCSLFCRIWFFLYLRNEGRKLRAFEHTFKQIKVNIYLIELCPINHIENWEIEMNLICGWCMCGVNESPCAFLANWNHSFCLEAILRYQWCQFTHSQKPLHNGIAPTKHYTLHYWQIERNTFFSLFSSSKYHFIPQFKFSFYILKIKNFETKKKNMYLFFWL